MEWKVAWKLPNNTRGLKEAEITKPEKDFFLLKLCTILNKIHKISV